MAIAAAAAFATGCVRHADMNLDCRWPAESGIALTVSDATAAQHLYSDLELAEELAIRHADYRIGRNPRPDVFGLIVTGVVPRNRNGGEVDDFREGCFEALANKIGATHALTPDEVRGAIAGLQRKPALAELLVILPLPFLFAIGATVAVRRIRARFPADEAMAAALAAVFAAVILVAAVLTVDWVWARMVETIRVGNWHLSSRGLRQYWPQRHRFELAVAGSLIFWIGLVLSYRRAATLRSASSARSSRQARSTTTCCRSSASSRCRSAAPPASPGHQD